MGPTFSMTALQRNPSQVKGVARDSIVRVEELGVPCLARSIRIAEEFSAVLTEIYSDSVLSRIGCVVRGLVRLFEMGSSRVRRCLIEWYRENPRQVPVSTFSFARRYDGRTVDVLALVCGPVVI